MEVIPFLSTDMAFVITNLGTSIITTITTGILITTGIGDEPQPGGFKTRPYAAHK